MGAQLTWNVADGDNAASLSYGTLANRSNQVANWLSELGARRGDRLLLMLGNMAPLWEVILAAMKLGVVIIPASTLLGTMTKSPALVADTVKESPHSYGSSCCPMSCPHERKPRSRRKVTC